MGNVNYWEFVTSRLITSFLGHNSSIVSVIKNNNRLYTASDNSQLIFWSLNGTRIAQIQVKSERMVNMVMSGNTLVTISSSLPIYKYDADTLSLIGIMYGTSTDLSWPSPIVTSTLCVGYLFTGTSDGRIVQWNLDQNWSEDVLFGHRDSDLHGLYCSSNQVISIGSKSSAIWSPTEFSRNGPPVPIVQASTTLNAATSTDLDTRANSKRSTSVEEFTSAIIIGLIMCILVIIGVASVYIAFRRRLEPIMDLNYTKMEEARRKERIKEEGQQVAIKLEERRKSEGNTKDKDKKRRSRQHSSNIKSSRKHSK